MKHITWRALERTFFTFFVGLVLVSAMRVSWEWPVRASIIVLVLGSCGVVLALVQLISDIRNAVEGNEKGQALNLELPAAEPLSRLGGVEIWAWIIGFLGLIQLTGFLYAIPFFTFSYIKFYSGGWLLSLALALFTWAFVFTLFDVLLHVPWPEPLLYSLFS